MKKRLVTAMVITGALALGACQEDPVMNELTEDKELNKFSEPGDIEKDEIPDPF